MILQQRFPLPTDQQQDLPETSYKSVIPILAQQFCKFQTLGAQYVPTAATPTMLTSTPTNTPLDTPKWDRALRDQPNREWVTHIDNGLQQGFRIGLKANPKIRSSAGNSQSATEHDQVITAFLSEQTSQGFMIGPLQPAVCTNVQIARMAGVPKKAAGKFRVVINLSARVCQRERQPAL